MARLAALALALVAVTCPALVACLDNGLLRTPNMGYNSWYDLQCSAYMNESTIRATAQAMVANGLTKVGYKYLNLDDCWAGPRTSSGVITSDPHAFPSGIKSLASYAHGLGMLFGVYTDRGTQTCAGRPGSLGYEKLDAQTYASWGVDFLKEDSCNTAGSENHTLAFANYALMRDSLNATGRPIAFDLCGWYSWYAPVGRVLGNLWRIGPDDSNWPGILTNININANLSAFAGPGGWNNPCLLLSQDWQGDFVVTELQTRAQFSMWAVMASPLTISGNVRNMTSTNLETYLNSEVIAVNQDPMGRQGVRLVGGDLEVNGSGVNGSNVWARPLADGSWAVVFLNTGAATAKVTCNEACFAAMGFDGQVPVQARDLWAHEDLPAFLPPTYTVSLPPSGGVAMLKVSQLPF